MRISRKLSDHLSFFVCRRHWKANVRIALTWHRCSDAKSNNNISKHKSRLHPLTLRRDAAALQAKLAAKAAAQASGGQWFFEFAVIIMHRQQCHELCWTWLSRPHRWCICPRTCAFAFHFITEDQRKRSKLCTSDLDEKVRSKRLLTTCLKIYPCSHLQKSFLTLH
jgi:hypothetical protein